MVRGRVVAEARPAPERVVEDCAHARREVEREGVGERVLAGVRVAAARGVDGVDQRRADGLGDGAVPRLVVRGREVVPDGVALERGVDERDGGPRGPRAPEEVDEALLRPLAEAVGGPAAEREVVREEG